MAQTKWKTFASFGAIAAVGGMSLMSASLFNGMQAELDFIPAPPHVTTMNLPEMRDGIILPHFAKISGIGGVITDQGMEIPYDLDMKIKYATLVLEQKEYSYRENGLMAEAIHLARREGIEEAYEASWSPAALNRYVEAVLNADQRLLSAFSAAQAFLLDEGISQEQATDYLKQSVSIALYDFLSNGSLPAGNDDRLEIEAVNHRGIVQDLHHQFHHFMQNRMLEIDRIDNPAGYQVVEEPFQVEPERAYVRMIPSYDPEGKTKIDPAPDFP